jgi:ABC-type polysaccharide/polyol phosphate export permease
MQTLLDSFKQLYRYRLLAQVLIVRDLKARYRGTVLGFLWCLLNPLLLLLTYVLIFSVYLNMEMAHFPVFLWSGLLAWTAFSSALNESAYTLIGNGSLIKKVFLPLELFPLVCVGTHTLNYLLSLPVLLGLLLVAGHPITANIVFLPLILAIQVLLTFGIALIVSAFGVQFRDLHMMSQNLLLIWFFLTPIVYPATMIKEPWQPFLLLNPMAAIVLSYQDILYYGRPPVPIHLLAAFLVSAVLIVAGMLMVQARREFIVEEV